MFKRINIINTVLLLFNVFYKDNKTNNVNWLFAEYVVVSSREVPFIILNIPNFLRLFEEVQIHDVVSR